MESVPYINQTKSIEDLFNDGISKMNTLFQSTSFKEYEHHEEVLHKTLMPILNILDDENYLSYCIFSFIIEPAQDASQQLNKDQKRLSYFITKLKWYSTHETYMETMKTNFENSKSYRPIYDLWRNRLGNVGKELDKVDLKWRSSWDAIKSILQAGLAPSEVSVDDYDAYAELLSQIRKFSTSSLARFKLNDCVSVLDKRRALIVKKLIEQDVIKAEKDVDSAEKRYRESSIMGLFGDKDYYKWWQDEKSRLKCLQSAFNELNQKTRGMPEKDSLRPDTSTVMQESGSIEERLQSIIGLDQVKQFVHSLYAQVLIQNERKKLGLPTMSGQTLHMIFKGNPGTGKTTIARIIGSMFYELGVIQSPKVVETDRSGLVAQYVGQTAVLTRETVERALDGILFIDEAYSLASDTGGSNGFGQEAIDTLVKCMEDYRDRLVVILAGYNREMNSFLNTNPGLASRFPNVVEFEDYTLDELVEIAVRLYKEQAYQLEPDTVAKLRRILDVDRKQPNFGNARHVRNIFEKSLRRQAIRIQKSNNFSKEALTTIKAADI
ncbi:AAA family ATPase [Paenibacillus lycopersici]|uniref:AAA family ATPase n=1 Tax=Paenibacillus lycopersici TaxID=2704462 RepID=A0A6C0G566_9BACL|nr:AAA family ATPase [Paenibacillus lycopersici]QHT62689.1 AAA family ATPase [Paenibacillus lycopersici]